MPSVSTTAPAPGTAPVPRVVPPFGFLTLATPHDYPKAVALAFSLRASNPGVPIAVACHPKLRPILQDVFDYVVDEEPGVRGFAHKVYLDRYSPFQRTLFFDSDVLVFRPVTEFLAAWPATPYVACGRYGVDGISAFGLDRAAVLARLGKDRLVMIDGAGHAFFEKPGCFAVFDRARAITADYKRIAPQARYADEDVMNIVMTEMELPPATDAQFFSRYLTGKPGSVKMDAHLARCTMVDARTLQPRSPCMIHFAANEAPFSYGWAMWRLYGWYGKPRAVLLRSVLQDAWDWHVKRPLRLARARWRTAA